VSLDAAGVEEVSVLPWPVLLRRRVRHVRRRARRRRGVVLTVILASLFTVGISITLLSNSLLRISGDLDASRSLLTWAIVGPMLAFAVVGPAYGRAGDLWGHKRVFVGGLVGAGVFGILSAFAWNGASLVVFRILSATAGSATGPSTMAFINRMYPKEERVRPLGLWSLVNAGAPVIGVVLGAPLVEAAGWRVIFLVQGPLCLLAAAVSAALLRDTRHQRGLHFDVQGAVTLGVSVTALLLAVNRGPEWGWSAPAVVGLVVAGIALLWMFARVERRSPAPLVPLAWLRRRNLVLPVAALSFVNFAYMGGFLLTPALLQEGLGYSESASAAMLICRPLVFAVAAPVAGMVTVRVGERVSGLFGALAMVLSMLVFARVGASSGAAQVVAGLALSGLAFGVLSPAMTSLVANAVDERDLGVAGAMQQLTSQLGAVLGAQVMESVRRATEDQGVFESFAAAFRTGMVAAGIAVVAAWFVRSTPRRGTVAAS
jgi:MFS family permease